MASKTVIINRPKVYAKGEELEIGENTIDSALADKLIARGLATEKPKAKRAAKKPKKQDKIDPKDIVEVSED